MKQKFLRWLTSSWMQSIGFGVDDLKLFGGELSDHQAFRQLCGYPGESSHDIAWQAHLSASARKAVTFLEQMIFGTRFDPSWKLSMKGSSEPAEIAKTEPFKDSLLEIEELVVKDEPKMDIEAEQQRDNSGHGEARCIARQGGPASFTGDLREGIGRAARRSL